MDSLITGIGIWWKDPTLSLAVILVPGAGLFCIGLFFRHRYLLLGKALESSEERV